MPVRAKTENITIVLNKPKYPGNVGSVARCARNMGVERISVVGNRDLVPEQMKQMATHFAAGIVDRIEHFDTLDEALARFQYIVGATSRHGSARGPVVSPREMAARIVDISHNYYPRRMKWRCSSDQRIRDCLTMICGSATCW